MNNKLGLLKKIFVQIESSGGKAYICGGYVRDKILGIESKDIDVEVFNLDNDQLKKILNSYGAVREVGASYPILLLNDLDFSLSQYQDLDKASLRRDFTINSLYYDLLPDKIIDKNGGVQDINNKLLRVTKNDVFIDDPLRLIRLAQFKGRFDFDVEIKTEELAIEALENIGMISKERLYVEFEKIFLKSIKPSIAFRYMEKIGLLKIILPEVDILKTVDQGTKYHPEGDAFNHTMLTLDVLPMEKRSIDIMYSLLLHDIGKAIVEKGYPIKDHVSFINHENIGADMSKSIMKRFTTDKTLIDSVFKLIKHHMYPLIFIDNIENRLIKRVASKVDFEKLMLVHNADFCGRGIEENTTHIVNVLKRYDKIKNEIKPIILGRDLINLGLEPGEEFKTILKEIYDAQLDERFLNKDDGLSYTKEVIKKYRADTTTCQVPCK